MTFVKTTLALSTAALLISAPLAFSADNGAMTGAATTKMDGAKTGSSADTGRSTSTGPTTTSPSSGENNSSNTMDNRGPAGNSHNGQ